VFEFPRVRRALGAGVLVLAVGAGGAVAAPATTAEAGGERASSAQKSAKKSKSRSKSTSRRRSAAFRRCGRSRSSKRLARRTTKRYRSGTVTINRLYCDGSRRITTRRPGRPARVVFLPAPPAAPGAAPTPAPAPAPTPAKPGFRLTLLHNNDGESKYKVADSVKDYGGVAHFKTVLERLRGAAAGYSDAEVRSGATRTGTVTISSGDNTLPGLNQKASFERRDSGRGPFYDVEALSLIGYDALTIGNHEYDAGPERLAQLIGDMPAGSPPFLTANTDFGGEPVLQRLADAGRIAKSTVVERGGERIGIIGVTPPETPTISSSRNVRFSPAVTDAINAEARGLERAGVTKVVLSSHLQNVANERTVVAGLRGVDAVIAGGGDELLADADDTLIPGAGSPAGAYPAIAKDADGRTVPIVTTQGEYRYVGRLTMLFDSEGRLTAIDDTTSGPVRVSAKPGDADFAPADATLQARVVDPLAAYSAAKAANVIGTTEQLLDGGNPDPIRMRESNLGDLVADGFRYTTNKLQQASGGPIAQIAFSNGGGIRTSIPAGDINEKQTFDVLPFDNTMGTVTGVTPERLKRLMEHGVAFFTSEVTSNGRFPQISGFRMTVDKSATAQTLDSSGNVTRQGERIRSLELDDGTDVVADGAIAPGAPTVNVATTNFTAGGGDGYPFRGLTFVPARQGDAVVPYQQSLFQYLTDPSTSVVAGLAARGGSVTAASHPGTGRITFVP